MRLPGAEAIMRPPLPTAQAQLAAMTSAAGMTQGAIAPGQDTEIAKLLEKRKSMLANNQAHAVSPSHSCVSALLYSVCSAQCFVHNISVLLYVYNNIHLYCADLWHSLLPDKL